MLKIVFLTGYLYLTPVVIPKGENGTFGIKVTQQLSDNIFLKVRSFSSPRNNEVVTTLKAYIDIDF